MEFPLYTFVKYFTVSYSYIYFGGFIAHSCFIFKYHTTTDRRNGQTQSYRPKEGGKRPAVPRSDPSRHGGGGNI